MKPATALAAIVALFATAGAARCETPASTAAKSAPKTYALVSAVGDRITYVRQRMQTGTSLEGYSRATLSMSDRSVDVAVLRGMDRVLARREPDSQRVFLRLSAGELDGVLPEDRERVALEKLRAELQKLPQRTQWDRIYIITPHYRISEMRGLAGKLHGVGIYVQGLETNVDGPNNPITGGQLTIEGPETKLPDGQPGVRSSKYVALYSHTQMWVLDAKTLGVIANESWLFDEKIYDPQSEALDVAKMLSPEQLAERFESFAERAAGRALAQTVPIVEPGEPRIVDRPVPATPSR